MWTTVAIVVVAVGAIVGTILFLRSNPNKANKINSVVDAATGKK